MNNRRTRSLAWLTLAVGLVPAACSAPATPATSPATTATAPGTTPTSPATTATAPGTASAGPATAGRPPDHVVIVVFENKEFSQLDHGSAPYLTDLADHSATYTNLHAVTHPSQPNYLALFSGSTHGVTSDRCPVRLHGQANLGRQLLDAGHTFIGYSEALPAPGFTGCAHGRYAAKHNPWVDFDNLPAEVNQPATALPSDFSALPTVSFLIPDLCNDMHDCPVSTGDAWAQRVLDPYVRWAASHHSALIVTFDEDDGTAGNRILTVLSGAAVPTGRYNQPLTLYSVLGAVERWYGLPLLGAAATAPVMAPTWTG
jgi:hypothetical protein